jgi:H+/Cl- antiporter ClcA
MNPSTEPEETALHYYRKHILQDLTNLFKWLVLAILVGLVVGAVSSLFAYVLGAVTSFREGHGYVFYFLPVAGVCIVFLYQKFGRNDGGTNQVLSTIRSQDEVQLQSAPLIFVSTALTHLTGGSAGREGAALQLGGSIGNQLGRWFHLDEEDRHVMVMCGMSAAFSAVFGTPIAAAVFSMEVVNVGVIYYAALLPCVIASLIAANLASRFGIHAEAFHVADIPDLSIVTGGKMVLVAIGCAVVSIAFCLLLRTAGKLYKRIANPYVRILVASALIIIITSLLGTTDYMGAGNGLIEQAVEHGQAGYASFLLKMLLTALTMKAGFRGGEIVPSFCIGATFGCVMGQLLGISPSICAAAGMIALFCGMTNCPLTSLLIAFELFGFDGAAYYLIAVAISYAVSGYYGLYKNQTIVYSKYKAKYVNHRTQA